MRLGCLGVRPTPNEGRVEERQMAFEMPIRVQYELLNGRITIMMYIYIYDIQYLYI